MIGGLKHLSKRDYTTAGTKDRHNKTELLLYRSDPCWSKICLNLDSWKLHFITRSAELTSFVNEPLARGIRKLIFRGFFSLVSFIFFLFLSFSRKLYECFIYIYIYIAGGSRMDSKLLTTGASKLAITRKKKKVDLNSWRIFFEIEYLAKSLHLSLSKNLSKDLVKDLASIWYLYFSGKRRYYSL